METVLLILSAVIAVWLFLLFPARPRPEQKHPFVGRCFAHRGLHSADKTIPENSMAAFEAARSAGYGIELDVQLSRDGQVVVFHDDTPERVCGMPGRIDDYTLEELRGFSLCGTEQRIPLLTEVLELLDGSVPLIIELKTGPRNEELCRKTWAILLQYRGEYCVESFDPRIIRWWRIHARQVLRGQLTASYAELHQQKGAAVSFILSRCLLNVLARPHFIAHEKNQHSLALWLCRRLGALSVVWTVHPEDKISALERASDAVIFELYTPRIRYTPRRG